MLKTRRRYIMGGRDYSAQEVRIFAATTQDPDMIKVYEEGKDLYSEVAATVYGVPYEECREFRPDGSFNLEGKKRRTSAKSIILGIQYGRGIKSIAEQIKSHDGPVTNEDVIEARGILEGFFRNYPKAKEWMENMKKQAHEQGYVEDLWGRRRRLPDASLPKYTFKSKQDSEAFNPLFYSLPHKEEISEAKIQKYTELLDRAFSVERRKAIIDEAEEKDGIIIKNNSGYIAQAERQSLNSPIQGGAATMTKLAIRNICRNKELTDLDFHLLVPVHDEVIAEFPLWNAERCMELFGEEMANAGKPVCKVPMKTDGDTFTRWYEDVASAHVVEDYQKHLNNGDTEEMALNKIIDEYSEFPVDEIKGFLSLQ